MSQLPSDQTPPTIIDRKKAIDTLWKKGVLSWKLDKNQKEMYQFSRNTEHKIVVIGSSRQLGKSYFLVTLAIEECLRQPYNIVKFIAPKVKDIKRIIAPLIREITADCPKSLRPSYKDQEKIFRFPNGSEIQLAGTDNGHAESIRGNKAHLCIIDEAGFCDELDYVVNSILIPTTTTTGGKIIMASTPSKSLDHPFISFMKEAEFDGRFIRKTIYDNPRLTEQQINDLAEALGGKDSVDFKREYLVQLITSEEDAVVPEFTSETKQEIVKEWPRPPFYDAYVSMDIGGGKKDKTVVLFAYYDFRHAKLIIEDELVFSGKDTASVVISEKINQKEQELWLLESGAFKPPHLRVADNNNPILLNDLARVGISFVPTLKDNSDAALNHMRVMIRQRNIIINPRCRTLIHHLETGIWNKARTSFARSEDKGHFDAIDSLKYLCRNVNYTKNPYPEHYRFGMADVMFTDNPSNKPSTPFEQALTRSFKVQKIRRR